MVFLYPGTLYHKFMGDSKTVGVDSWAFSESLDGIIILLTHIVHAMVTSTISQTKYL